MIDRKQSEGYVSRATLRGVHLSPRKARLVVDLVRGKDVDDALTLLEFDHKKTSQLLRKLLLSAVANARDISGVDVDELYVKSVWVNEGKTLHRHRPRARGRATGIRKRHSHITVLLDERAE